MIVLVFLLLVSSCLCKDTFDDRKKNEKRGLEVSAEEDELTKGLVQKEETLIEEEKRGPRNRDNFGKRALDADEDGPRNRDNFGKRALDEDERTRGLVQKEETLIEEEKRGPRNRENFGKRALDADEDGPRNRDNFGKRALVENEPSTDLEKRRKLNRFKLGKKVLKKEKIVEGLKKNGPKIKDNVGRKSDIKGKLKSKIEVKDKSAIKGKLRSKLEEKKTGKKV